MAKLFETNVLVEEFHKNGFVVVPDVFDSEEIASFCTEAMKCFHEVLEEHITKKGGR